MGLSFRDFYEACAKTNKLAVGLAIDTVPEQPNQRECYLPEAAIYDPTERADRRPWGMAKHDPGAPQLGLARTVTFLATVKDGETLCCSGKLSASIKTPHAERELERMAGALISQGRAQAKDFDPTR